MQVTIDYLKMFFAKGEIEKLPHNLRKNINRLDIRYQLICYLNDEKKDINRKIIDFTIDSLNLSLKYYDRINKKIRNIMTEAVGNIPMTLDLDNIKISKEIEETINPLIDIIDAHACLEINRKELIKEILKKLQKLKKKFKGRRFPKIKITPPSFSEKKYPKSSEYLNSKFKKCEKEAKNILKLSEEKKNINKEIINFYINVLRYYIKNRHPYFIEWINNLPAILVGKKIKIDENIEDILFDQINRSKWSDIEKQMKQKLKEFKKLQKKN